MKNTLKPGSKRLAPSTLNIWAAGGYLQSDLNDFFGSLGQPVPNIVPVSVNGGKNSPGNAGNQWKNGWDSEVTYDIEMVGALSPGATIVAYFSPGGIDGCIAALSQAIDDSTNHPSVLMCMTVGLESSFPGKQWIFEGHCQDAAAARITVLAASGDHGETTGVGFPARCPHALGIGGTVHNFPSTPVSDLYGTDRAAG
jgi:kumamolisin